MSIIKEKRYLFPFVVFVAVIALLIGCFGGGKSDDGNVANLVIQKKLHHVNVFSDGSFFIKSLYSPISVSAPANSLKKDTVVYLTERDSQQNESPVFGQSISSVYTVTAYSTVGDKTYQTSVLDKPLLVTINQPLDKVASNASLIFGLKDKNSEEWQYTTLTSNNNTQIASGVSILSDGATIKVELYRLDSDFAIFSDEGKMDSVKGMTFSSSPEAYDVVKDKEGKSVFKDNIIMSTCIEAVKSSGLFTGADVETVLTFVSPNSEQLPIKINGKAVAYKGKPEYDAINNVYTHTISVKDYSPKDIKISGNLATYSFTLDTKDVPVENYPLDFLIKTIIKTKKGTTTAEMCFSEEIHKTIREKILKEKVAVALSEDADDVKIDGLYYLTPSFTFEMTDKGFDKKALADAIQVSDVPADKIKRTWDGNSLKVTITEPLKHNSSYTISLLPILSTDGINTASFTEYVFTTLPYIDIVASSTVPADKATDVATNTQIVIEFDYDIDWNENAQKLVTINKGDIPYTASYTNKVLTITPKECLPYEFPCVVQIGDLTNKTTGQHVASQSISFTTVAPTIGQSAISNASDSYKVGELYVLNPHFFIDIDKAGFDEKELAKAVKVSGVDPDNVIKKWIDGRLEISFAEKLKHNASYTVSMDEVKDSEGYSIASFTSFTFQTLPYIKAGLVSMQNPEELVATNTNLLVQFDYDITWGNAPMNDKLVISCEGNPNVTYVASYSNKLLSIIPSPCFNYDTKYTLNIGTFTNDITGQEVTPASFSFTTVLPTHGVISIADAKTNTVNGFFVLNPNFQIDVSKEGIPEEEFSRAIRISNVDPSKVNKQWLDGKLVISFNEPLEHDTEYKISMITIKDKEGYDLTPFYEITFKTLPRNQVTMTEPAVLVDVATNTPIILDFEYDITWASDSSDLIRIMNGDEAVPYKGTYENKKLTITPVNKLKYETDYKVVVGEIGSDITKQLVEPKEFTFRTIDPTISVATIADASGNEYNSTGLYIPTPKFIVDFGVKLVKDKTDALNGIIVKTGETVIGGLIGEWEDNKVTVSFENPLPQDSEFTIDLATVKDTEDYDITSFTTKVFKTLPPINAVMEVPNPTVDVATNTKIVLAFDMSVDFNAPKDSRVVLKREGVEVDYTAVYADQKLTITPSECLVYGSHSVTVNGLEHTDSHQYVPETTFNFDTVIGETGIATVVDASGNIVDGLYQLAPVFTIEFSKLVESQSIVESVTTVKNVTTDSVMDKVIFEWTDTKHLKLSFSSLLDVVSTYTISMGTISDTENINFAPLETKTFSTLPLITASIDTDAGIATNVATNTTIVISFDYDVEWTGTSEQLALVSINDGAVAFTPNYNSATKKLTLTPNEKLAYSTDYTVKVGELTRASTKQTVVPADYTFTTVAHTDGGAIIADASRSVVDSLYVMRPDFVVSFENQMPKTTASVESAIKVVKTADSSELSNLTYSWNNGKLTVGFDTPLEYETEYEISMATVKDTEDYDLAPFTAKTFTTLPAITVGMTTPSVTTDVATNTQIVLDFSYPIDWSGTSSDKVVLKREGVTVSYSATYNDKKLTITPSARLAYGNYTVDVATLTRSQTEQEVVNNHFSFTTVDAVYAVATVDDASGNIIDGLYHYSPVFNVEFSKPIYNHSEVGNVIYVVDSLTLENCGGAINWIDDTHMTLSQSNLKADNPYKVQMSPVNDSENLAITPFAYKEFTTLPHITASINSPVNGATDIATNTSIVLTFDYDIEWTGSSSQFNALKINNGSVAYSAVYDSGNKKLTITPTTELAYSTLYTVAVGALERPSSKQTVTPVNYTFTTVAHTDGNSSIVDGENVIVDSRYIRRPTFKISFSNQIPASQSSVESAVSVKNSSGVTFSNVTKSWTDGVLTLGFSSDLDMGTTYTVSMATVKDTENYDIISFAPKAFETLPAITPTLTTPSTSTNVATNTQIVITFDYPIDWSGTSSDKLTLKTGGVVVPYSATYANKVLTVTPTNSLAYGEYTVSVGAFARSQTGQTVAPTSFNFATVNAVYAVAAIADTDSSNIVDSLYVYQPSFDISFTKPVLNQTDAANAIVVTNKGTGSTLSNVTKSWVDSKNLKIGFSSALDPNITYSVSMGTIKDTENLTIPQFTAKEFKTLPHIIATAVTPSNNATEIATNTSIVISFDYDIEWIGSSEQLALVKLNNGASDLAYMASYDSSNKKLTLTPDDKLEYSKVYTVSVGAITRAIGQSVTPAEFSFTTEAHTNGSMVIADGESVIVDGLYIYNPTFKITFNNQLPMNQSDVEAAVKVLNGSSSSDLSDVAFDWIDDSNVKLSFTSPLAAGTQYKVYVASTVKDRENYDMASFTAKLFNTLPNINVAMVTPSSSTGIATNTKIVLDFNYDVEWTGSAEQLDLVKLVNETTSTPLTYSSEYNSSAKRLTLTPTNKLEYLADYSVSVGSLTRSIGQTVKKTGFNFTTVAHTTGNALIADGSSNVVDSAYKLTPTFDISFVNQLPADHDEVEAAISVMNASTSTEVTGLTKSWNNNVLTIGFENPLAMETKYTVSMAENAVKDTENYYMQPFTAKDIVTLPPVYAELVTPTNSSTGVATNTTIVIGFNYDIEWTGSTEQLSKITVNDGAANIDYTAGSANYNSTTKMLTLNLTSPLAYSNLYTVTIDDLMRSSTKQIVRDSSAHDNSAEFSFTTGDHTQGSATIAAGPNAIVDGFYVMNPTFKIGFVNQLPANKTSLENAITVTDLNAGSDLAAEKITKAWDGNVLTIGFTDDLTAGNGYAISMAADVDDTEGYDLTPFTTLNIQTLGVIYSEMTTPSPVSDVATNTKIVIGFSEDIEWATTGEVPELTINGGAVNYTSQYAGQVLTLTPTTCLAYSTTYTVAMNGYMRPTTHQPVVDSTFTFDTIAPTLSSAQIAAASGNTVDGAYVMKPSFEVSFTNGKVVLSESDAANAIVVKEKISGTPVANVTKTWTDHVLALGFTENLASDTAYVVSMADGVLDSESYEITKFADLEFTTLPSISVAMTTPVNNADDVATTTNIVLEFSHDFGWSGTTNDKIRITGETVDGESVTVAYTGSYSDKVLTLTPEANLIYGNYTVTVGEIGDEIIRSATGQIVTASTFNFTTPPPVHGTIDITPDAANVVEGLNIWRPEFDITFNTKTVMSTASAAAAVKVFDSAGVETSLATKNWNASNNIRLSFTGSLSANETYTVHVDAVKDIEGLLYTPPTDVVFTTLPAISLVSAVPADTSVDIATNSQVVLTFSHDIEWTDDSQKSLVAFSDGREFSAVGSGNTLTLTPTEKLSYETTYTVSVGALTRASTYQTVTPFEISFTTLDPTYGNIATDNPDSNRREYTPFGGTVVETLYGLRPTFTITFDKDLKSKTDVESVLSVNRPGVGGSNVSFVTKTWTDDRTLEVGFSSNLTPYTEYQLFVDTILDSENLEFNPYTAIVFKTLPQITATMTTPVPNATGVATNTTIVVAFDSEIPWNDDVKSLVLINDGAIAYTGTYSDKTLTMTPNAKLPYETDFTVKVGSIFNEETYQTVTANQFNFRTLDPTYGVASITDGTGNVVDGLYVYNPTFSISVSAKEPASKIDFANAISVIDASTSAAVGDLNKNWSGDVLELSFATSLSPSHQYTVTMADVADTEGYNITKFADKVFTTLPNIGVAVTPADTAVDVATNSTIVLAFDYDIGWTGTAAQYNLLHLKKESVELSYFANYDSTSKVLTLTPTDKFEYLTDYTLSVGAFGRATGQTVVARDYTFTTVAHTDGIASITTPIGSIIDGLYTRHPLFDISFINQKPANTSAVESAITVTNASTSEALSTVNKSWNNGVLTIGFSEMLDMSTEYTISLATVKDTENYDMVSFTPMSFTVLPEINVAMTLPVEGSLSNATSTPIVLTFDYDIEWTGMPGELESVKINSGAVDYTAVYNSASKSLTLSPSPKLNYLSSYTVDVVGGASGLARGSTGQTCIDNHFEFSTADAVRGEVLLVAATESVVDGQYSRIPTFTVYLSDGKIFGDETATADAVSVVKKSDGSAVDTITKNWNNNKLTVSFSEALEASTEYTISMTGALTDNEGYALTNFASLDFTTLPDLTVALSSPLDGSTANATDTKIILEFSDNIHWTGSSSDKINVSVWTAEANATATLAYTATYSENKLKLSLASGTYLEYTATYTVTITDFVSAITYQKVADETFTFTTVEGVKGTTTVVIPPNPYVPPTTDPETGGEASETITIWRPSFTITFDKPVMDPVQAAGEINVRKQVETLMVGIPNAVTKTWSENNTKITVEVDESLEGSTQYGIIIGMIKDSENLSFKLMENIYFKTLPPITATLTSPIGLDERIATDTPIVLTFSVEDPSLITNLASNLILTDGVENLEFDLDFGSSTATIKPKEKLKYDTTYTIKLPEGLAMENTTWQETVGMEVSYTTEEPVYCVAHASSPSTGHFEDKWTLSPEFDIWITKKDTYDEDKIASSVYIVKASEPDTKLDILETEWSGRYLLVTTSERLEPETDYIFGMEDVEDSESLPVATFSKILFTTGFADGRGTEWEPFIFTEDQVTGDTVGSKLALVATLSFDISNAVFSGATFGDMATIEIDGGETWSDCPTKVVGDKLMVSIPIDKLWPANRNITVTAKFNSVLNGTRYYFATDPLEFATEEATSIILGSGTSDNPYLVYTANQLAKMTSKLNYCYSLVRNVDFSGVSSWQPVGSDEDHAFSGEFNGNGFTISNLNINKESSNNVGFFGCNAGYVYDLNVDGSITGNQCVGAIAGMNFGTIENCISTADVTGNEAVGGIAGYDNYGNVTDCSNEGSVHSDGAYAGGIVGQIDYAAEIEGCNNTGIVYAADGYAGGIIGCIGNVDLVSDILVRNCVNEATINGEVSYVGGIVGYLAMGQVNNCKNTGDIDTDIEYVGGIAGYADGAFIARVTNEGSIKGKSDVGGIVGQINGDSGTSSVDQATNNGDVLSATNGTNFFGGIAGESSASITNCRSNCSVVALGSSGYVGGVVGSMASGKKLDTSFFAGEITAGSSNVGGLVGSGSGATISNSFVTSSSMINSNPVTTSTLCGSGSTENSYVLTNGYKSEITGSTWNRAKWSTTSIWTLQNSDLPILKNAM